MTTCARCSLRFEGTDALCGVCRIEMRDVGVQERAERFAQSHNAFVDSQSALERRKSD